jgi:hypothetical protein
MRLYSNRKVGRRCLGAPNDKISVAVTRIYDLVEVLVGRQRSIAG